MNVTGKLQEVIEIILVIYWWEFNGSFRRGKWEVERDKNGEAASENSLAINEAENLVEIMVKLMLVNLNDLNFRFCIIFFFN